MEAPATHVRDEMGTHLRAQLQDNASQDDTRVLHKMELHGFA